MHTDPPTPSLLAEAAGRLAAHPWIGAAAPDPDGSLRVRPDPSALAVRSEPGGLVTEYLEHWGEVYDWTYTRADARHDSELDLSGWRASDTGRPLPVEHMREWIEHTVELVLSTGPRWILELGCGTGLLMYRLRDRVRGYVGTDVAAAAVTALRAGAHPGTAFVRAAAHEGTAPEVRAALAEVGAPDGRPDCVLLNSVTQCFPGVGYLRAVLEDAIGLVASGGTVIIGDVRDSRLLASYARWVEKSADPAAGDAELERRATDRAIRDEELLFDPPLLARLADGIARRSSRTVRMSVHPKTMTGDTELTRYRFDAVLHVDAGPSPAVKQIAWTSLPGGDRLGALAALLPGGPVHVHGIPNALLAGDSPDAVPASRLCAVAGARAAVVADPGDPAMLGVVIPAESAARPVEEMTAVNGTAHDPFIAFTGRRLQEVARAVLRRSLPAARDIPLRIDLSEDASGSDTARTDASSSTGDAHGPVDGPHGDGERDAARSTPGEDRAGDGSAGPKPAAGGTVIADGRRENAEAEDIAAMTGRVGKRASEAVADADAARIPEFLDRLDRTALLAMAVTLRPAGLTGDDTGRTCEEVADALGVADRHRWILRRWLGALVREGLLARDATGRFHGLRPVRRNEVIAAGRGLEADGARIGYPMETTRFLLTATTRLPELLRDEVAVQALLFADDDLGTADGAYRENTVNRYLNAAVGETLRWTAERAGRRLRVLELGAGVGGTTVEALRALDGHDADYLYTDVSRYFLSLGRERFGDRPGVGFAFFDINADPAAQGVPPGSQDVVLSANVLHNARHVRDVLCGLRGLLAPGALFVFVETCREMGAILASMQFLMSPRPGERRLHPADLRNADDRVFLTRDEWLTELTRAGLRPLSTLPGDDHPLVATGLHLFVARRD
ncbi:Ubiquinone/menaquinone biosynthesis C-methylase UbiE [Thermomonospora echinospora]|uniref:Ubiquinone/menaquinone biosynthesis C-methylase UbiE n=1 Tax=Thermomonospora echinospora TaxID=1992 RepID=A0A1H6DNS2_9ACTN|nr:class I SAM-dependent methyltransferase [Thermomonospora echinospora]SEG86413.1 Ubiquinone/menaquinone biosynthesis C-methylase UbiE [Thermomonospora echinospora]